MGYLARIGLAGLCATLSAACREPPRLAPGTGGLRVSLSGVPAGARVHVWAAPRYGGAGWRAWHVVASGGEALFVDLPPDGYRVAASDEAGHGGYYGTLGGVDWVGVDAGRIATARVSLETGVAVHGVVLDARTRAPLANTYVTPPAKVASERWPVRLPWFWSATDADGRFALGGLPSGTPEVWFDHEGYTSKQVPLAGASSPLTVLLEPAAKP